jgi:hypothetical protein
MYLERSISASAGPAVQIAKTKPAKHFAALCGHDPRL